MSSIIVRPSCLALKIVPKDSIVFSYSTNLFVKENCLDKKLYDSSDILCIHHFVRGQWPASTPVTFLVHSEFAPGVSCYTGGTHCDQCDTLAS